MILTPGNTIEYSQDFGKIDIIQILFKFTHVCIVKLNVF